MGAKKSSSTPVVGRSGPDRHRAPMPCKNRLSTAPLLPLTFEVCSLEPKRGAPMFLTDEQWQTIEEPSAALGQLEQICGDPRQRGILRRIALRDAALGKATLPGARRQQLSFYQDAELVENELALMPNGRS